MAVNLGSDNQVGEKLKAGITYVTSDPRFCMERCLGILGDRPTCDPRFSWSTALAQQNRNYDFSVTVSNRKISFFKNHVKIMCLKIQG